MAVAIRKSAVAEAIGALSPKVDHVAVRDQRHRRMRGTVPMMVASLFDPWPVGVLLNAMGDPEQISEPAGGRLRVGLEETTVVKLGLPAVLGRTLATTNPIESIFDWVRYRTRRVKS